MSTRWLAAVATVLGGALVGCGDKPPAPPPPPTVTVAAVAEHDVTNWEEFTGRLEAMDAVEIRPRTSGYITRVAFTDGTEVRRGEVLFEIDPRPYAADLARAAAELERARTTAALAARDASRAQRLVAAGAISREEFDASVTAESAGAAAVRVAEAALTTARLNLEWTEVRSPIAGRVSRAAVTVGNLVQAGPPGATLLTTVVSIDPIYAYFDADEQTYLKHAAFPRGDARAGREPVYLGLANEQGFPHQGHLDFVDNRLNPETGTIRLRAVFSNKERLFTPGLYARLKLAGSGHYRAPLILDGAIGTDQDKKFVLVLNPDSTVAYRPVQLGPLVQGLRVVVEGVKAGDTIVINGLQRVRPGAKVMPIAAPMVADTALLAKVH